jgi:hypothetical protein
MLAHTHTHTHTHTRLKIGMRLYQSNSYCKRSGTDWTKNLVVKSPTQVPYFATCNFHIKVCIAFRKRVTLAQQLRTSPSLNCKLLKSLLLHSSLFLRHLTIGLSMRNHLVFFLNQGIFFECV